MKHKLRSLAAATALLVGASLTVAGPASADTGCTQSTDQNTGNLITVCNQVIGEATATVNEQLSGDAQLILVDKGHVYLNVQVGHMTRRQIGGRCKNLRVGTFFWNGFVDPQTHAVKYKAWRVTKGDQKFCVGRDHRWHKYSCNNPVKGKPFHTPPAARRQRVYGRVSVVDYATWRAYLEATLTKHISADITVQSPDNSCKSTVNLDNTVQAHVWLWEQVKNRTSAGALSSGASSIKQKALSDQTVLGSLNYDIQLLINDKLSGKCTSTSSSSGSQPQAPTVSITTKNQVGPGETATVCADYNVYGTDPAALKFLAELGAYPGGNTFPVSGVGSQCTEYQAPDDADRPPSDKLTAQVRDNTTGVSASDSTSIAINYTPTPM